MESGSWPSLLEPWYHAVRGLRHMERAEVVALVDNSWVPSGSQHHQKSRAAGPQNTWCSHRRDSKWEPRWSQPTHVSQAGLELEILLPQPPKCWNYSWVPSHLALLLSLSIPCSSKAFSCIVYLPLECSCQFLHKSGRQWLLVDKEPEIQADWGTICLPARWRNRWKLWTRPPGLKICKTQHMAAKIQVPSYKCLKNWGSSLNYRLNRWWGNCEKNFIFCFILSK
jgi:hypothetical protein